MMHAINLDYKCIVGSNIGSVYFGGGHLCGTICLFSTFCFRAGLSLCHTRMAADAALHPGVSHTAMFFTVRRVQLKYRMARPAMHLF
jgi:hypothetical protein